MDQQLFEQIEAYIQNKLSAEAKAAFEQRLESDPQLKKEVDLQLELTNAIETEAMQTALHEIHQKQFGTASGGQPASVLRRLRPLAIAASVALVFLAGWWIFRDAGTTPDGLLSSYYETPPGLPTSLGIQESPDFNEGMVDYKLGNFEAARKRWRPLITEVPNNDTLQFFLGVTYLETRQADSAIIYFQKILRTDNSNFSDSAKWLLSLSLIENKRTEEALPLLRELAQTDNAFRDKARNVLMTIQ